MMHYTLTRSKRKTVAIYIRDGHVEVRAPYRTNKRDIERFIMSKEKWIAEKLANSNELADSRERFTLDYGSRLTYRGVQYPIEPVPGGRAGFDGNRFYMPPGLEPERIKAVSVQTYRRLAKIYIIGRTRLLARSMTVNPSKIRITSARTRWGSCSANKNVNFSWRLVMASDAVIEYVIIHELAHLIEMNHSERFWRIVENALPNYRERKKQLNILQEKLNAENWE